MPPEIEQRPDESRIQFYQNQAQAVFDQYGRNVDQYVKGYETLIAEGEKRLRSAQATGYNFLRDRTDMDLTSSQDLIFYSHAIYYPRHLGILLATMEHEGLIKSQQIEFGVRSSTVLTTGGKHQQ